MKNLYFLFIISLLLGSCGRESVDSIDKTIIINPPNEVVNGSVSGVVIDENGPVASAEVSMGTSDPVTTDSQGQFSFLDAQVFKDGTYIRVEKEGYLSGSRRFQAVEGSFHNVKIQLTKRNLEPLDPATGKDVMLGSALVTLPSGQYLKDGTVHNGDIHIHAEWLDPTLKETFYKMPGNLTGISTTGTTEVLTSFGMMRVELFDGNGLAVELPDNKSAILHFPIPEIMEEFAPDVLSLWSFDEENGIWTEDGLAVLEDDHYSAEVTQLSFWNLSLGLSPVEMSGVITLDGMVAGNQEIVIRDIDDGYMIRMITSEDGTFSEIVPRGNNLIIEAPAACLNAPYTYNFEGLLESTEDVFNLESGSEEIIFRGNVVDCNGTPVPYALLRFKEGTLGNVNEMYRADAQGNFEFSKQLCLQEAHSLFALDHTGSQISDEKIIYGPSSTFTFSDMMTCTDTDVKFELTYDGMDWATDLQERGIHTWDFSRIQGGSSKIILVHALIHVDGELKMESTFRFNDEQMATAAEYRMKIFNDGNTIEVGGHTDLNIKGTVDDPFRTYGFSASTTDVTVSNNSINVSSVMFDLVYFD